MFNFGENCPLGGRQSRPDVRQGVKLSSGQKRARKTSDGVRPERVQNSPSLAKSLDVRRTTTTTVCIAISSDKKTPRGFPLGVR